MMRPERFRVWRVGPGVLARVAQNFGAIVAGQLAATMLGFAALALNTNALGLDELGRLMLVQAAGEMALGLCSFQSWSMVVKFGASAINARDGAGLRAIWRFGLMLDALSAAAAALVVLGLFLLVPEWIGLSAETGRAGAIYAATLAVSFAGSSTGILRLCDGFRTVIAVEVAVAAMLCGNAAVLSLLGSGFGSYLVGVSLITAIGPVTLNLLGWRRLRRVAATLDGPGAGRSYSPRDMLRFALGSSGVTIMATLQNRAEFLIVGNLLGPAAGALFGVAYRFGALFSRFAEAGRQSVYPELGHLVSGGRFDEAVHVAFRLVRLAGVLAVLALGALALWGGPLLSILFGSAYAAAWPNMMLISAGMAVGTATFALDSLVVLRFGADRLFGISLIAFCTFIMAAVAGPLMLGTVGAGAGRLGYTLALAGLSLRLILRGRAADRNRFIPDKDVP